MSKVTNDYIYNQDGKFQVHIQYNTTQYYSIRKLSGCNLITVVIVTGNQ